MSNSSDGYRSKQFLTRPATQLFHFPGSRRLLGKIAQECNTMVNESPIGETSAAQAGAGWGRYVSAVAGLGNDGSDQDDQSR